MKQNILFVVNPHSGKGQIKGHLVDIIDVMVKAEYDVTVYITQQQGDGIEKIITDGERYDRIFCSGGDGTLDEVVTGMIRKDLHIPLGYIPAGSTNDFANSLGIPKTMIKAAEAAVAGQPFLSDVGSFNGDTFVYVAAFGLFTDVSYNTPQPLKNIFGHLAYIMEGAKHILEIPSIHMKVETEEMSFEDDFIFGMVSNSTSIGGFKGMTGPDVHLDDGVFEVTFIRTPKNAIELNEILACFGNLIDDSDLIYSFKTQKLEIQSKEKVAWTLDGEFGGEHEQVLISNLKQRIPILVSQLPAEESDNLKN